MFVDDSTFTQKGHTYRRVLLRNSYRIDGKVRHDTIANLSQCSDEDIEAIKLALKHKSNLKELIQQEHHLTTKQGLAVGALWLLYVLAKRLGITKALGRSRKAKLALWMVLATVIEPGSRLSAVRLAQRHAVCDILGLDAFNEDDLYEAMTWLSEHQVQMEERLFSHRYGGEKPPLYFYDVTSSYLEGDKNALAAYGYNRDRKKGKLQIVVGLMTDQVGRPICAEVFEGNTQDPQTVRSQIAKMADRFGLRAVTLVGDRGMIKSMQIEDLEGSGFHYITAITKPQINSLIKQGVFEMGQFCDQVYEVSVGDVRYILRRNVARAAELGARRADKLACLEALAREQTCYLAEHTRAQVAVARQRLEDKAKQLYINSWAGIVAEDRHLRIEVEATVLAAAAALDGCYVLKTDLPVSVASAELIHARYKDLAKVEWAFRTMKTVHLELRPVYVRTAAHTQAHVFTIMLAYLLVHMLGGLWHDVEVTVEEAVAELASVCSIEVIQAGRTRCQTIPEPRPLGRLLLEKAGIKLPDAIPCRRVNVVTRKKLTSRRKST